MQPDDFFCFQAISSPLKTPEEWNEESSFSKPFDLDEVLITVKKKLQGEASIQHGRRV
jgi:hypothetical protein